MLLVQLNNTWKLSEIYLILKYQEMVFHYIQYLNQTQQQKKKKSANIIGVVEFARIIGQLSRIGKIQIDEGAFYEQREFVEKSVSSDLFGTDDIIATDLGEENPGLYALFFQMSNTGNSAKEMIADWGFKNTK